MAFSVTKSNSDNSSQRIIQCPACQTKFAVASSAIESIESPRFHCSRCDHVFSMLESSRDRGSDEKHIRLAHSSRATSETTEATQAQTTIFQRSIDTGKENSNDRVRFESFADSEDSVEDTEIIESTPEISASIEDTAEMDFQSSDESGDQSNHEIDSSHQALKSNTSIGNGSGTGATQTLLRSLEIPKRLDPNFVSTPPYESEPIGAASSNRQLALGISNQTTGDYISDSEQMIDDTLRGIMKKSSSGFVFEPPASAFTNTPNYFNNSLNSRDSGSAAPALQTPLPQQQSLDPQSTIISNFQNLAQLANQSSGIPGNVSLNADNFAFGPRINGRASSWTPFAVLFCPLVLFLIALAGFSYILKSSGSRENALFSVVLPASPQAAPAGLHLFKTRYQSINLDSGDNIKLISGTISNRLAQKFRDVLIEVSAYDRAGNLISRIRSNAAFSLAKTRVKSLNPEMIRELQSGASLSNRAERYVLKPGEKMDFAFALSNLDSPDLSRAKFFSTRIYSVRIEQ